MLSNLLYTGMVTSLVTVCGYTVYSTVTTTSTAKTDNLVAHAMGINQSEEHATITPHADQPTKTAPRVTLIEGTPRDEVLVTLGHPDDIDVLNDRWTYGSYVIQFRDNKLMGCVKTNTGADPVHGLARTDVMFAGDLNNSGSQKTAHATTKGVNPLMTQWGGTSRTSSQRQAVSATAPRYGSARASGSYNGNGYNSNSGSYYMNQVGAAAQPFYRRASLPRGMSHIHSSRKNSRYSRHSSSSNRGGSRSSRGSGRR